MTRLEYMQALVEHSSRGITQIVRSFGEHDVASRPARVAVLAAEVELWVRRSRAVDLEIANGPEAEGRYDDRALLPKGESR